MSFRFAPFAIVAAILLSTFSSSNACAAASPDHQPAEAVLATAWAYSLPVETLSVNYSARLAPVLLHPSRQTLRSMVGGLYTAAASRFNILPNVTSTMAQNLDAVPVIGTVRRRAGRRFNTDDASIDDFAICYRLSSRLGFQFLPTDPAPVKLAVASLAHSNGFTAGLTLRLRHR